MADKIRKCIVCGNGYKYCPHCSAYNENEKWRFIYCSEDCRMIDAISSWYNNGNITQSEAKAKLGAYTIPSSIISKDVTAAIMAIKTMGNIVEEIKAEEVKVEETPIEEASIPEVVTEDIVTEEVSEVSVEEPAPVFEEKHEYKSKKKKYVNEV